MASDFVPTKLWIFRSASLTYLFSSFVVVQSLPLHTLSLKESTISIERLLLKGKRQKVPEYVTTENDLL